jgi:hypothetical protein
MGVLVLDFKLVFVHLPSVGSFAPSKYLFISFACPKETNQRKRQPQIFFGLNILSVAHALQLPFAPLRVKQ